MYFKDKFTDGPNLITVPITKTRAVTILILVPVGSRYETKKINGTAHFIEHMMFKGTKNRPTNLLIAKELDALGAEYNAFTAKDLTSYWIKLDKNYLDKGLEIISDMLFNSLFTPDEFKREKGVILEEIKMYQDNPLLYIDDLFEQTLYGDCPLGWSISGQLKNIQELSHEVLMKFLAKHYQVKNMLVVIAGDINRMAVKKMIGKYFLGQSAESKKADFKKYVKGQPAIPRIKVLTKESQQVQLALGFPAYSYRHPYLDTLMLLSIILGGNMSSRLFTEIRVKRGLAYSVRTDLGIYQDTGNFVVRAGVDYNKILETVQVILDELKKIINHGVGQEELSRVKTFFAGKLSLDLEDSAEVAGWYGRQDLLINKIYSPEQKIKLINKINGQQIQRVAKDVFKTKRLCLAIIGQSINRFKLLSILQAGL